MKIVHTSDLHIGKRLYHIELLEDQQYFFNWLIELIKSESADALLVSGDVFDVANPSSEARKLYYNFLIRLSQLKCKVLITGGNHDSPAVLDAPREILETLDIHVVGSLPQNISDVIIPLPTETEPSAIVAAIPFLRDRDLRALIEGESYSDRLDAIRSGIIKIYDDVAALCKEKYPGVPLIAMGHLYVRDGIGSDSERDVQIGNQAGVDEDGFTDDIDYYALGHLHQPQEMEVRNLYYSGSPYPLSFSERDNQPRVMMIETVEGKTNVNSVPVPKSRRLLKYAGKFEDVKRELGKFQSNESPFKTLIELEIIEENYDPNIIEKLEKLEEDFTSEDAIILKSRVKFKNSIRGADELYSVEQNIEDLAPNDVFQRRLENEEMPDDVKQLLTEAFNEVLEMLLAEE